MRSRIPLLVVVIALLILGILIFFGIINRYRQVVAALPTVLENELEARLFRDVSIGSVRLISPGTAIIDRIVVSDRPGFGPDPVLSVERAVVRFNMISLLLGRTSVTRSMTSVTLTEPRFILVRNRLGEWSIEDLLGRPPIPAEQRFRGDVRILSGRLAVVDYAAETPTLPAVNTLGSVSGSLGFAPADHFLVDLRGVGTQGRVREVAASGRWGITEPVTNLRLTVNDAGAEYWLGYFTDIQGWNLSGGTFDVQAVLSQPRGSGVIARGSASVSNSAFTSPHLTIPIQPFAANINFVGNNLNIDGRGLLRRSPVRVRGRILGFRPVGLDLRVTSDRMDMNTLQTAVRTFPDIPRTRWTAPAVITANVTGTGDNPLVRAQIRTPNAVIFGIPARQIVANGIFREGLITITSLTAQAAGGRITASGRVDPTFTRITASGTATGVNLSLVSIPVDVPVGGIADARFSLTYAEGLQTARISAQVRQARISSLAFRSGELEIVVTGPRTARATVSMTDGSTPTIAIRDASAVLALSGRQVLVRELVVRALQGTIRASGSATTDGALNLRLSADDMNLRALLSPLGIEQLTGIADFEGTLTGTIENPQIAGRLTARNGRLRDIQYEILTGRLIATRESLFLEDVTMRLDGGEVVTTGRITVAAGVDPELQVRLQARQVDLAELFRLIGLPVRAEGVATADLDIRGQLPNIQVSGDVSATNAVIAGIAVDLLRVRLQSREGVTTISEFLAQQDDMLVTGSGFITRTGRLQVDLAGENLRLSLLNRAIYPYLMLEGPMAFSAEVRGTLNRPVIQGVFSSPAPVINGQVFDVLSANIAWGVTGLTLSDGLLQVQDERYEIPLFRYNPNIPSADLRTAITSGSISRMLGVLRNSPIAQLPEGRGLRDYLEGIREPVSGTVNAALSIMSRPTGITGSINLAAQDLATADAAVGTLTASVRLVEDTIFIDQLSLSPTQGQASVQGSINPDGLISLTGQLTEFPLSAVGPWIGQADLSGTVNMAFTAVGPADSPTLQTSIDATDVRTEGVSVDSITAEQITVAGNRISSDAVIVQQNASRLIISGSVPFVWATPFIPRDQPLMVQALLQNTDLALLESLDAVDEARGVLTGQVSATGTLDQPVFNGSISLQDGFLNLRNFENDFTDVTLNATFQDSMLLIESFGGNSSLGGSFSTEGNISFGEVPGGEVAASINLNDLRLDARNLSGTVGERMIFTTNGQLNVTGTLRSPLIQGLLVVRDARITIPTGLVPTTVSMPTLPISPQFAITVNLARDVFIERGGLTAEVIGPLTIAGSLEQLVISGTVQVVSGRLRYAIRSLDILPGGTASILLQPGQPAVITVDVTARTRVTTRSPLGIITRYTIMLDITGPVGDLDIGVRSSPPGLTELEALSLIFGGAPLEAIVRGVPFEEVIREQIGQVLLGFAIPELFQPFEVGDIIFAIEPGYNIPIQVSASAFLTERVILSYNRSVIGTTPLDSLSISYTLSPSFALSVVFSGEHGSNQETTYLAEYYRRF